MPVAIHHAVIIVNDLDISLRFYRDGIGLEVLQDRTVQGDWPALFNAPSRTLRAVFLGDAQVPDDHAGVLELNVFDGEVQQGHGPPLPRPASFCCHSSSMSNRHFSDSLNSSSADLPDESSSAGQTDQLALQLFAIPMEYRSCSRQAQSLEVREARIHVPTELLTVVC